MKLTLKANIVPGEVPKAEGCWVEVPIYLRKEVDALFFGEEYSEELLPFIPKGYIVTATQVSWP